MTKVDRRITKSQEAIKKAVIDLMSEKKFDDITIQDIADKANVNRGTIYLHYLDKFDLLDKIIEEHISRLTEICETASEMDFIESTVICFEYFERHYLFFSTMLVSEGAPYFRNRYLAFLIKDFRAEVDITQGKNSGMNEDILVQFIAAAYVRVMEWWLTNEMPYPPEVMAEQLGDLIERIV